MIEDFSITTRGTFFFKKYSIKHYNVAVGDEIFYRSLWGFNSTSEMLDSFEVLISMKED